MPNRDGRGPLGNGPATGRGYGACRTGNQAGAAGGWGGQIVQRLQYRCRRLMGMFPGQGRFADTPMGAGRGGRSRATGASPELPSSDGWGGSPRGAGRNRR